MARVAISEAIRLEPAALNRDRYERSKGTWDNVHSVDAGGWERGE